MTIDTTVQTWNSPAQRLAVQSISAYKRYISPYKGFACAHRQLHGGESCSSFVQQQLLEQDLTQAVFASMGRFKDCSQAAKQLRGQLRGTEAGFRCIILPCCFPL